MARLFGIGETISFIVVAVFWAISEGARAIVTRL